ncbi:hypothetical protein [Thiocapsa rosea]|uniref:Uncharacterized protein n=1 Tax=Thiocapsa rosea TaxID=69360 RepID=A0A495VAA2_9GAMM|nr:hypothetical protein [Thiocapsa rosea]RKT46214.1 hypothetical protein BDD21_3715 [Thiocapsa rosea]
MHKINGSVTLVVKDDWGATVTNGTQVDIQVSNGLPGNEIDAVYIRTQGNGGRCVYSFSNYSESATGLRIGGAHFKASDVTVCSDGVGTSPPEVIEPISTAADACEGVVFAGVDAVGDLAVVSGVSLDGKTVAVCAAPGSEQFQCVNRCENFEPRGDTEACAQANLQRQLGDGQKDLDACRPCDLADPTSPPAFDKDGNPLFYCWEYASSVVRNPPLNPLTYPTAPGTEVIAGTEIPRTPGTILPHPSIGGTSFEVQSYNPCTTTTTWLNGRQYTYTTCR